VAVTGRWVGVLPVHWHQFGVRIPVIDSWFIASYSVGQNVTWVSTVDSQQFWTRFHPKWLLNWRQKTWSPSSQTLPKPTWSCKIYRTLLYKIPTSLTIFRTSLVDLPSSVFQQHDNNHPWSPQLAVQHCGQLPAMCSHVYIQRPIWWLLHTMGHCPPKHFSNVHESCWQTAFRILKISSPCNIHILQFVIFYAGVDSNASTIE